jgi:hypothetical protein
MQSNQGGISVTFVPRREGLERILFDEPFNEPFNEPFDEPLA